jgi:hypothetical protein
MLTNGVLCKNSPRPVALIGAGGVGGAGGGVSGTVGGGTRTGGVSSSLLPPPQAVNVAIAMAHTTVRQGWLQREGSGFIFEIL